MLRFGFVTEGATDQAVLKNILSGLLDTEDLYFYSFSPALDESGKSTTKTYSNWQVVLEYCTSDDFEDALEAVDYLIIQLDTDISERKGFDIAHTCLDKTSQCNVDKTVEQLIDEVGEFLKQKISLEIYEEYQEQIIFAISVHSIECWLLPIFFTGNSDKEKKKREKMKDCFGSLINIFQQNDIRTCDKKLDKWIRKQQQPVIRDHRSKNQSKTKQKKDKKTSTYENISKPYIQNDILISLVPKNESLSCFILSLIERIEEEAEYKDMLRGIDLDSSELQKQLSFGGNS